MTTTKRSAGQRLPKSKHPVFSMPWLLERSQINEQTGCWEWQLAKNNYGYPLTWAGGGISRGDGGRYAHREVWQYRYGAIPNGLCICHTCDNPSCVNPDHLWLGSRANNSHDMVRKGRHHWQQKTAQR